MISKTVTEFVQETFDQPVDQVRFSRKCLICVMREQDLEDPAAMVFI